MRRPTMGRRHSFIPAFGFGSRLQVPCNIERAPFLAPEDLSFGTFVWTLGHRSLTQSSSTRRPVVFGLLHPETDSPLFHCCYQPTVLRNMGSLEWK
jgi:hypothetical protein